MAHIAVIFVIFNRQHASLDCLRSPTNGTHVDRRTLVLNYGVTRGDASLTHSFGGYHAAHHTLGGA